ncbi:hypothetical protein LTR56_007371 [Elasticomyces elasticus]|nr:hypothetical protein LTR56_007371 [Elasticomyces elasticus]KAK3668086.1 hypothetical protein LTR22_001156 [Elasticomyces elasticus]KAK4925235.1 hypothetical protein LTR49_007775 [Elasticomyces elasticus]KAK5767726.1 hypothetical protein LTS12_002230 [Elasticomyces elasticus]
MSKQPTHPTTSVQEVITVTDITNQILTNAQVLFPREQDLKVVSAQAQSGVMHYASLVASDPKSASVHKEYKVVLNGPAVRYRRESMMGLLDETERRVAKQILKK